MENEFYTKDQIAERAGCSGRVVYNMRKELMDAGAAVQIGRAVFYYESAICMVINRPDRRRRNE